MRKDQTDRVTLLRAGEIVTTLPGAFGRRLRETRVTALLGYLIAMAPEYFTRLFRLKGKVLDVTIEANYDLDRADILINTTYGCCIVEAKFGRVDPVEQSSKYKARWKILLTDYAGKHIQERGGHICYVNWSKMAEALSDLVRQGSWKQKFMCGELLGYLKENNVIKKDDISEIYAREINEETSLNLFLQGRIYGCQYQKGGSIGSARYFAPHFGKAISSLHPGVAQGISYVARIEDLVHLRRWTEYIEAVKERRGAGWLRRKLGLLRAAKQWHWGKGSAKEKYFMFLGEPRLVFNPPIDKFNLQRGAGWLSKRNFTFDELFAAWLKARRRK